MGYDPFSPIALAQINVLCVPASRISKDEFEKCVKKLRSCSVVRLGNAGNSTGNNAISPSGGWTVLNIASRAAGAGLAHLFPFEPNRAVQIVVGVVSGRSLLQSDDDLESPDIERMTSTFNAHVETYEHAISSSVIVFGADNRQNVRGCHWTSLEAGQSSLNELMAEVVAEFHRGLPVLMEKLRAQAPRTWLPAGMSTQCSTSATSNRNGSPVKNGSRPHDSVQQDAELGSMQNTVFGLLHLQAGQWSHAMRLLTDGAVGFRGVGNHLWHAKALEGLMTCMLMCIWDYTDFSIPQICYPSNDKHSAMNYSQSMNIILSSNRPTSISLFGSTSTSPASTLAELTPHLLSTIIGLYERTMGTIDNAPPLILLCEARIRWLNLLASIKVNGNSLSAASLQNLIGAMSGNRHETPSKQNMSLIVLSKTILCQMMIEASNEAQQNLAIEQNAAVQTAIARSFSLLEIERKQGFHLKQFLHRLAPALLEAQRRAAAELGVHPSANLPPYTEMEDLADDKSQKGIQGVLSLVARVYGLPLSQSSRDLTANTAHDRLRQALVFWVAVHGAGDLFLKLEILSICIEISDAVPDAGSCLYFTSYLLQAARRAVTVSTSISKLPPLITSADLPRLLQNMRRATLLAETSGVSGLKAEYWDKFLCRDVVLMESNRSNRLMQHTAYDLSLAAGPDSEAKKDPFIFNPFAKPKTLKGDLVVTTGDNMEFSVVLQNPLDVEIEIESIMLLGEGSEFESLDHSIVLGPLCTQAFMLHAVAKRPGRLRILGCRATVRGCYQEDFLILPTDWQATYNVKDGMKSDYHHLKQDLQIPGTKEVLIKVIESLPSLSVASSSLLQPSLMLLEGESSEVELTLLNTSPMDIDFITLTFDDSVTRSLEDALSNKELNPSDIHEAQFQLINNPAVTWLNENADIRIKAGEQAVFHLQIFGKPGLSYIDILIDYAYLGKPKASVTESFYTRQLNYSIATTINGSVNIPRCLIMPFQDDLSWTLNKKMEQLDIVSDQQKRRKTDGEYIDRCMLLLDVRNVWPYPLEINVAAVDPQHSTENSMPDEHSIGQVSDLILPGQVNRLMLLIPRIFVLDAKAMIPNLDKQRQFVVSVSKMSMEAEAASREAFWYRERLLRCLQVTWKEPIGLRRGQVDMRKSIRLNARMIDALRVDQVEIFFSLKGDSTLIGDGTTDIINKTNKSSPYTIARNQFAILVAHVHNRGDMDLRLLVRLQPSLRNQPHSVALELSKRFVWSGSLQQALHPPLRAGETREMELGIAILAAGEYEVSGVVEEVRRSSAMTAENSSSFGLDLERRIWYARQPCLIDVHNN